MTQREIRWSFVNIRAVVKRARLWYRIAKAVNERTRLRWSGRFRR